MKNHLKWGIEDVKADLGTASRRASLPAAELPWKLLAHQNATRTGLVQAVLRTPFRETPHQYHATSAIW